MRLVNSPLTAQNSWDLCWMGTIGNGGYGQRLMVIAGRQLNDAEYSGMKHNWYVDQPCKFLFSHYNSS
jgi:hypothetical protein